MLKHGKGIRQGVVIMFMACALSGCASLTSGIMGIPAIPANRVPPEVLNQINKNDLIDISLTRLRQDPPDVYLLASGDVLGVYIENVLGSEDESPPVHFPEDGDDPPAVGFPIPIRDDGTISLPFVNDIYVEGKTLDEVDRLIENEYTVKQNILTLEDGQVSAKIIVTLIRKRQFRVLVVREESGGLEDVSKRGRGDNIDLDAYENDVLHALNETGGMSGVDAKNEIVIYRGLFESGLHRDEILAQVAAGRDPCFCAPPIPGDPNIIRIPLRYHPSQPPRFDEEDIILQTGDIVMIELRDREKYYTGGALPGGEHPLPRDEDLDILGAIARAGGFVGAAGTGLGGVGQGGGSNPRNSSGKAPSQAIILRKLCNGGQIAIRVDLNRALMDPRQRILIQPEDTIIVQYTLVEELFNTALGLFQVNYLINGLGGGAGF